MEAADALGAGGGARRARVALRVAGRDDPGAPSRRALQEARIGLEQMDGLLPLLISFRLSILSFFPQRNQRYRKYHWNNCKPGTCFSSGRNHINSSDDRKQRKHDPKQKEKSMHQLLRSPF
ncbi:MAG: hypothetical protein K5990_04080 [Oscillospiraceae bacterium]|nr:hypothetical protein [Oscillospiraceae bacterium]